MGLAGLTVSPFDKFLGKKSFPSLNLFVSFEKCNFAENGRERDFEISFTVKVLLFWGHLMWLEGK